MAIQNAVGEWFYPSTDTSTWSGGTWTITYPDAEAARAVALNYVVKEELAVCVVCGAGECFIVCNTCKLAIVEVRNRIVSDMIEEMRP